MSLGLRVGALGVLSLSVASGLALWCPLVGAVLFGAWWLLVVRAGVLIGAVLSRWCWLALGVGALAD